MAEPTIAEQSEQWGSVGAQVTSAFLETLFKSDIGKFLIANGNELLTLLLKIALELTVPIGTALAKAIADAEDHVAPHLADMAAAAVSDAFGTNVPASTFARTRNQGGRQQASSALGAGVLRTIEGGTGALQPGQDGAERYLSMVLNMALEGWYQGFLLEFVSSLVPQFDIGKIESFAELDDTLAQALGLGRLSRRVLGPLIDAKVVTPFEWKLNKLYTPRLLAPGELARQIARGRGTRETWLEEFRRQGYREDQIEAILNGARKFFSASDVRAFVARGHWTKDTGLQHLKDQGYEPDAAEDALRLEGLHRFDQLEGQEAAALISAYADRRIDRVTFGGMLSEAVQPADERALLTELAEIRRAVNVKGLSPAEARACVKAQILSVRDYRLALERDGYEPDAILALELLLRHELEEQAAIEELRAAAVAERAAERAARDAALAARKAQIDADRALARRGAESDLEQAVVRGLIPFARLEEVYAARYDADTVAILLELVEDERLEYLARLQAREEALQRGARRNISAGDVEQAFMLKLLAPAELRARLLALGFDEADADLLTLTAVTRLAELDAARAQRKEADKRATTRKIDLGRFERLVRRGARTLAQYDALLAELGFEEASRAAMRELLELTIAEDARAREERDAGEARLRPRGLSLEQFRRGVLLGVKTVADFEQFLIAENFTADAQIVLLAELRAALADADAARRRRDEAAARVEARELPIGTAANAARLGVISPDAFVARLEGAGFSAEDVDVQLELLLLEIADVQAARARREAAEADAQLRGLSLADVERAVKAGVRSIEDYRARASQLGYTVAAVDDLVELLRLELAQLAEARRRRETIGGELVARNLSIGQLEEAVTKGFQSLDDFIAGVVALGYGLDDAELLAALLAVDLEAKAAA